MRNNIKRLIATVCAVVMIIGICVSSLPNIQTFAATGQALSTWL